MYFVVSIDKSNHAYKIERKEGRVGSKQHLKTMKKLLKVLEYLKENSRDKDSASRIKEICAISENIADQCKKQDFKLFQLFSHLFGIKSTTDKVVELNDYLRKYATLPFLPNEMMSKIFSYLPIEDQSTVKRANALFKDLSNDAIINRAREFGYHGDRDFVLASKFLKDLFKSVNYNIEEDIIPKKFIIYKRYKYLFFHVTGVDIEATIWNLKKCNTEDIISMFSKEKIYKNPELSAFVKLLMISPNKKIPSARWVPFRDEILITAIRLREKEVIKLLLKHGADPNVPRETGSNALHWAAMIGDLEIVKFLAPYVSDINQKGRWERTALCIAAYHGNNEVVKFLLKSGANTSIASENGNLALHLAAQRGHIEVIRTLIPYVKINESDHAGRTALSLAAQAGKKEVVNLLLANGASATIPNNHGSAPIHYAAQEGHVNVVERLLSEVVNIDAPGASGYSALFFAAEAGREKVVELLLLNGSDPNLHSGNGIYPLHLAVLNGNLRIVQLLAKRMRNINPIHPYSRLTPLGIAKKHGHIKIAKFLRSRGAR
jgi:ankyrin repeat protein